MAKKQKPKADLCPVTNQPIRIQISTSDGSETAAALEEVRGNIPPAFRKNFNLGAYFKEVLQDNDAKVAAMIRGRLEKG